MVRDNDARQYASREDRTWSTAPGEKINTLTRANCMGEILKKMNRGGEVVVAMPSNLYWEDKSLPKNNTSQQYYIPKWSVVIFVITTQ
jgi:uncharacterized protein involved in propanediol utilization